MYVPLGSVLRLHEDDGGVVASKFDNSMKKAQAIHVGLLLQTVVVSSGGEAGGKVVCRLKSNLQEIWW